MTSSFASSLSFAIILLLLAPSAEGEKRPLTIDDMMSVEGIGSAQADPQGRWFFFEKKRPYDQMTDYSFRTYAFEKTGHQLWRYDLRRGGDVELVPGIDPQPSTYLQGFSPSGRFLAVMQYRFGALTIGAYDVEHERLTNCGPTPAFSRTGKHNPVWISDDEFIYSALPEGVLPSETSARAYTGRRIARAWEDAWRGDIVTADEVRTVRPGEPVAQEDGRLVLANARTGHTEIVVDGLLADLRVSPDHKLVAGLMVSKPRSTNPAELVENDPRRYTLTIVDIAARTSATLAPEIEFYPYTITWSSDGQRIAAFGWKSDQDVPRDGRFYVIELKTGEITRYDHTGLDLVSERERGWLQRPERAAFLGDQLVVYARVIPKSEDQSPRFSYADFFEQGLPRADWFALSSDGVSTNLTSDLPDVSGVPVGVSADSFTITAKDGVYRIFENGVVQRLTPELDGRFRFQPPGTFATRSSVIRPEFADEALFQVAHEGGGAEILMVDLRPGHEGATERVSVPSADTTPLAGSLAARAVLFSTEDGPASRVMVARDETRNAPQEIARLNTGLLDVDFGQWRTVSYEVTDPEDASQTREIESCVLLPPNYDGQQPLPLVVDVYPNARPSCPRRAPRILYPDPDSPYLWGERGYAYARLTTPSDLIRTAEGPIAGIDEVIVAGVDALIDDGLVDPSRVVLRGYSQGGVAALYIAAQTDRFSAVIAENSWADLFSHYFGGLGVYSTGFGELFAGDSARYDAVKGSDFGIGRTPFDDPEIYYRNSPVFLAPKIKAPVLLIHSDMDSFPLGQFDEMYGALLRSGKDARYVRYWGEGHGPSSPANIRDRWDRIDAFLDDTTAKPVAIR